jgi:hypothetical protein
MAAALPNDRGLVVLDSEPGKFLFSAWLNVVILVWVAQADQLAVIRLKDATSSLATEYPRGRSCVSVITPGLPFPADGARAGFIEVLKRSGAGLANFAVVVLGEGFERSALISYHTSMGLTSTGTGQVGFLRSIEDLADWLPRRHRGTGVALDPEQLSAMVERAIQLATGS